MKIPQPIKAFTSFIFKNFSKDIGSVIIWTTISAWVASSIAQITGILLNKNYTSKDKAFLIPQELGDAAMNIGLFFALTYPLKKFATKLGSTGKIISKPLKDEIARHGDLGRLGKMDFDISKLPYLRNTEHLKEYYSFNNFLSTSAAVVGGIVSSNIVTPILRNRLASKGQSEVLKHQQKVQKIKSLTPHRVYAPSAFDRMRTI